MGKYSPLKQYFLGLDQAKIRLSFGDIAKIIGDSLPKSAYSYRSWWGNHSYNSQAKAWLGAGFQVEELDLSSQSVLFLDDQYRRELRLGEVASRLEAISGELNKILRLLGHK